MAVARKAEVSDVMTAAEVGAFLGLSRNSVYEAAGRGEIPCRRVGRRLIFYRQALVRWLSHLGSANDAEPYDAAS